jgi:tryptophan 2,3-dioxygenase
VSTKHTAATARVQRRLERWELQHLRQHAAELAVRLEEAERRLSDAEDAAEFWREQHIETINQIAEETGGTPGLTMGGQVVVVPAAVGGLHA